MPFPAKISALLLLTFNLSGAFQTNNVRFLQGTASQRRAWTTFPKQDTMSDSRLYLELSDILDDDSSEFLEALRRQMDGTNILNASPREITNRIKGFFAISKRSPEEILHFKKYLETNKNIMDVVNSILLVEGCTRCGVNVKDLLSWNAILSAMEKPSTLFTSSMVYRGLSSVRKVGAESADGQRFLRLLWDRVEQSRVQMETVDICPSVYCMQTISSNSPAARNFLGLFAEALDESREPIPSKTLCSAIFGLKKMKAVPEVRKLVAAMAKKITTSEVYYHPVNICIALNGLQGMDDSVPEVRALMTALMDKAIAAEEQGLDKAGDREISMALFGLQRMGILKSSQKKDQQGQGRALSESGTAMEFSTSSSSSSSSPELLRVVHYISTLLDAFDRPFEARRLGFALMGISGMSSTEPVVQEVVNKIAARTEGAWGELNSQEMSMCLHGLAGLQSDSAEVRRLVAALTPLLEQCDQMTASDIRSAMYGLQGLYSSSKEVNALINAFSDLFERSQIRFSSAYDLATALYSMQGLSSSAPSTRRLMKLVARALESVQGRFEARDISMALYGMKELNSMHDETQELIARVVPHIKAFDSVLTTQNVAAALQGLQKLRTGTKHVNALVGALAPHIARTQGVFNAKGLSMALSGLQGLNSRQEDARRLIDALASLMERSEGLFEGFEDFHQIATAFNGLAGMSTEQVEVRRLVDSLSRLMMHPLVDMSSAVGGDSSVKKARRWNKGEGLKVVDVDNGGNSVREPEETDGSGFDGISSSSVALGDDVRKSNLRGKERFAKMAKNVPKAEKVATALFGMQGLSARYAAVRTLMEVLEPFVAVMPPPNGKSLGMALQGFKASAGKPPSSHAKVLTIFAEKLPGWSKAVAFNGKRMSVSAASSAALGVIDEGEISADNLNTETQVTLRSALWGIAKLDRSHPAVRAVLKALATEVLTFDMSSLDRRSVLSLGEVYKGGGIETEPEVQELLTKLKPLFPQRDEEEGARNKNRNDNTKSSNKASNSNRNGNDKLKIANKRTSENSTSIGSDVAAEAVGETVLI